MKNNLIGTFAYWICGRLESQALDVDVTIDRESVHALLRHAMLKGREVLTIKGNL